MMVFMWFAWPRGPLFVLAYLGLGLAVLAWKVCKEYAQQPATLKFWTENTGFPLNVRHARTRELMLRSKSTTLAGVDLHGAKLAGADLVGVDLHGANLQGSDLCAADLRLAKLWTANLQGSVLQGADLRSADLDRANLEGADLRQARLGNTTLDRTSFRNADLRGASFVAIGFDMVLLQNVLATADFTGARWNNTTRWPKRFDPITAGALYVEGGEADLPIPHHVEAKSEAILPIAADNHQPMEATQEALPVGDRR